jgi:glycosyltransferase involved in cell wall biosynthesis
MSPTVPRVTVVIPTYNRARFLPTAIDSVLAQTYGDFALLVADNASDDGTPEVVARYDDPRIRFVRRPENLGITANHNLALEEVRSEYCLIVPDDDVLFPSILQRTVPVLDENPRAGMVHARFQVLAEGGEVVKDDEDWTYGLHEDVVEPGDEFLRESMLWSCRVCASTALMRMEALPDPPFDQDDYPAIDFGMWLRMALDWDLAFLATPLAGYRIHRATHSAAFGPPRGSGYTMHTEIVKRLKEVKLRFVERFRHRLGDVDDLRARAARSMRRELIWMARNETLPERRFRRTVRALGAGLRLDPKLAAEPAAWSLLAGSVLGPRGVDRLRTRRSD